MEGTYPVILDGREQGTIEVWQEGLLTVFRARCADPGTLVRLSLYGEKEGYLGVMAPGPEGLELTRRLSRAAIRDFPRQPRYAAPAGQPLPAEGAAGDAALPRENPETVDIIEETYPGDAPEGARDAPGPEEVTITQDALETTSENQSEQGEKIDINIEIETAVPLSAEDGDEVDITNDTVWYAGPGGCLYSAGAGGRWLAVPAAAEADPTGGRGLYREIQGRSYLLFRTGAGEQTPR